MVYDSIASTLPYLKDNDSYTNFIKSNIINQLQVVKSKHITSLYNTPHKTVKQLPIITKWKYIALSQNQLILKRQHLLATKQQFLAYMPYNVQIIVITTWASERSNLGVFKDTIKIMAERLELSETYSLHTWAL